MARRETPDLLGAQPATQQDDVAVVMGDRQMLNASQIQSNGGTQMRAELDQVTVEEYAAIMREARTWAGFPPVIVYYDGQQYWLADGFHRLAAWRKSMNDMLGGRLPAEVRAGTRRDAILHAAGANAVHGLRRTNADKRRAVETLLRDDDWGKWSDREIARRCAVDHVTVGRVRAELSASGENHQIERTVQRGGTTYTQNTANIGTAPRPSAPTPTVAPAASQQVQETSWANVHTLEQQVLRWLSFFDEDQRDANLQELHDQGNRSFLYEDLVATLEGDDFKFRQRDMIQAYNNVRAQRLAQASQREQRENQERIDSLRRDIRQQYDQQLQQLRQGAVDTIVQYAPNYNGVLRWIVYEMTAASFDELLSATQRELYQAIAEVLVDRVLNKAPGQTIQRLREMIDERFNDVRLQRPMWPESEKE